MIIARIATLRQILPAPKAAVDLEWQPWWIKACRSLKIPVYVEVVDGKDVMLVDAVAVRFRVFVSEGKIVGITNKDPNRPLDRMALLMQISRCDRLTDELARKTRVRDFAVDWIVLKNGHVMFDYGSGPRHEGKTRHDTCCFRPGLVSGIAMEDRNGG